MERVMALGWAAGREFRTITTIRPTAARKSVTARRSMASGLKVGFGATTVAAMAEGASPAASGAGTRSRAATVSCAGTEEGNGRGATGAESLGETAELATAGLSRPTVPPGSTPVAGAGGGIVVAAFTAGAEVAGAPVSSWGMIAAMRLAFVRGAVSAAGAGDVAATAGGSPTEARLMMMDAVARVSFVPCAATTALVLSGTFSAAFRAASTGSGAKGRVNGSPPRTTDQATISPLRATKVVTKGDLALRSSA